MPDPAPRLLFGSEQLCLECLPHLVTRPVVQMLTLGQVEQCS